MVFRLISRRMVRRRWPRVRGSIHVELVGNLIYLKARSGDPVFASKVANTYAHVFIDSTQSRRARVLLLPLRLPVPSSSWC